MHASAIADHVTSTGHNLKWDHFEILAKGRYSLQDKGDSVYSGTETYPKRYCQQRKALSVLVCIFLMQIFSQLLSLLLLIIQIYCTCVNFTVVLFPFLSSPWGSVYRFLYSIF